jgi:hypothetical protein
MANGDNPLAVLELGDAQAEARKLGLDCSSARARRANSRSWVGFPLRAGDNLASQPR